MKKKVMDSDSLTEFSRHKITLILHNENETTNFLYVCQKVLPSHDIHSCFILNYVVMSYFINNAICCTCVNFLDENIGVLFVCEYIKMKKKIVIIVMIKSNTSDSLIDVIKTFY